MKRQVLMSVCYIYLEDVTSDPDLIGCSYSNGWTDLEFPLNPTQYQFHGLIAINMILNQKNKRELY